MARTVNYIAEEDLAAFLTQRDLIDALDDDGDETADAENVTACIEAACDEIDGAFAMRGIAVPLDVTIEIALPQWSKYLFCAHAYQRRGIAPERMAHGAMIKAIRDMLAKIATGRAQVASLRAGNAASTAGSPLGVSVPDEGNVIDVVSEEAMCTPRRGRVLS